VNNTPSEAEIKIELPNLQKVTDLKNKLIDIGFAFASTDTLQEYYITKTISPYGGWDLRRLRSINNAIFVDTTKEWSNDDMGNKIRLEDESAISRDAFDAVITQGYDLHFTKQRDDYKGIVGDLHCTVSIDTLENLNKKRVFIECEAIVSPDESHATREMLRKWVARTFAIDTSQEAASMIDIVSSFSQPESQNSSLK
jgi:hypothetical protein